MSKVFISYSWDSEQHKERVKKFVKFLRSNSIEVIFDDDIKLGERLPEFMQRGVRNADYVLLILTPTYRNRADKRYQSGIKTTGVGYENTIINSELYSQNNEEKFIPVLFDGTWEASTPYWAEGKYGTDFSNNNLNSDAIRELLATIGKPKHVKHRTVKPINNDDINVDAKKASNRDVLWYVLTLPPALGFFITGFMELLPETYHILRVPLAFILSMIFYVIGLAREIYKVKTKRASKKKFITMTCLIILLIICSIGGYLFMQSSSSNSYNNYVVNANTDAETSARLFVIPNLLYETVDVAK